jgi:glycosyltransferase involved in cell wall biosynthesis
VVGDAAIPYSNDHDLAEKLQRVLRDGSLVQSFRQRAQARIKQFYDWEHVVDRYEDLFAAMANKSVQARAVRPVELTTESHEEAEVPGSGMD